MAELTAFDVIVLLLVFLGALAGLARGFVTEVLSLAAWVAAFMAVRFLFPAGKALATQFTGTEAGGAVLAFAVIFLVAFVAVRAIARSLGGAAKKSVVGGLDRLLGLGFGAAKGVLAASVIYLLATMSFEVVDGGGPRPEWLQAARTAPVLALTSQAMVDFVEERRGPKPRDRPQPGGKGYAEDERNALDRLLDRPGTTI